MAKRNTEPLAEKLTDESVGVKVRVLQSCRFGGADDVVEVDSAELASAKDLGFVDDDPEAVAYAESLIGAQA